MLDLQASSGFDWDAANHRKKERHGANSGEASFL